MNAHEEGSVGSVVQRFWHMRILFVLALLAFACVFWLDLPRPVYFIAVVIIFMLTLLAVFSRLPRPDDHIKPVRQEVVERLNVSGRQLAEILSDPLIVFDKSANVLYANQAATNAFQPLDPGTTLFLRFRAPEMHGLLQSVIADGKTRSIDYFERVPLDRWYKAIVMPVSGQVSGRKVSDDEAALSTAVAESGKRQVFVLIFRDQSETRRIDRMRSDFIANASHELRTPLASLRGFIETLQGPARNDEKARERFLGIMQKQADRMSRLIDDLLSLSRLEMRAHLNVTDRVDLTSVLNHVADTLAPLAEAEEMTIIRELPQAPLYVIGSRDELIQVFQNLLENACKYGQGGKQVVLRCEINSDDAHPEVAVSVQDFGMGIPPEHLPRLTERFYRVDVETSRTQKGTGLGLAIVKHILARHRGRLAIRSQLGEGSTFTVRLPLKNDDHN